MSKELPENWCAYHQREEIPFTSDYIVCGECWHLFNSPRELLDAHNKLANELDLVRATTVEQVFACPLCAHDF